MNPTFEHESGFDPYLRKQFIVIVPYSTVLLLMLPLQIAIDGFHFTIHLATLLMSLAMFAVSLLAYSRDGRKRLLLISTAFLFFALRSGQLLVDVAFVPEASVVMLPTIGTSLTHIFDFLIVVLFSVATLAGDKGIRSRVLADVQ